MIGHPHIVVNLGWDHLEVIREEDASQAAARIRERSYRGSLSPWWLQVVSWRDAHIQLREHLVKASCHHKARKD